jgi:formyltetrahydrofolate-dependent phosphoribosylglycinamide formyltransferase
MVKKNSCVFISGKGSNLQKLIKSSREYNFPINIKIIISNKKYAPGLILAKKFAIPYYFIESNNYRSEIEILNILKKNQISIICLAGFMKILSKNFINNFRGKIINIHPSLLPKYKGTNTFSRILKNKEKFTGCTVHYVNDKLDSGKIILKRMFELNNSENVESLKSKTQEMEYRAYSEAVTKIFLTI